MKKINIIAGTLCLVAASIINYHVTKVVMAHTESNEIVIQPSAKNVTITIKSNNINNQYAGINDVVTLNYILKNKPSTNKVTIAKQSVVPVCSETSNSYNCSAAIKITSKIPVNDGVIPFSISLDSTKTSFVLTTDNSQVIVGRSTNKNSLPVEILNLKDLVKINTSLKNQNKIAQSTDSLREMLTKRKILMMNLMKTDSQKFLLYVLSVEDRKKIPTELQSLIESEVTEQGTLEVVHVDNFKDETKSYFTYTLRQGQKATPLYIVSQANYLTSGDTVQVKGYRIGDSIVVESKNFKTISKIKNTIGSDERVAESKYESVGDQKTLVFLIRFQDSGPVPFSKATAQQLVFNGQFQKFIKEESYNKTSFNGTVLDWITIQRNADGICDSINIYNPELQNVIAQNITPTSNYKRILFLIDRVFGGCSVVGTSNVNINNQNHLLSQSWVGLGSYNMSAGTQPFSWTNLDYILSHEMGHALGVRHANGWECGTEILRGDCQHIEYGNYYDTMGSTSYSLHFNAFYKEMLGWINPSETVSITDSGTYTISPLEVNISNLKKIAKIKGMGEKTFPFYLEYRKGVGFDSRLNTTDLASNKDGLFINKIIWNQWDSRQSISRLLDMTPHSSVNGFREGIDRQQVTLNGNNIFQDLDTGISIGPIISHINQLITFKVGINQPQCIHRMPVVNTIYGADNNVAGASGYLSISLYNPDSPICSPSEFNIQNIQLPLGWTLFNQPYPTTLDPDNSMLGYVGMLFIIPADAIAGRSYPITFDLANTTTGLRKTITQYIYLN